jgi:tungstate transport system substrate-binding protein
VVKRPALLAALLLALPAAPPPAALAGAKLRLGSTTSVRDSGLLDAVLPGFEAKTGIAVETIAVGTGQALALGERGDVDVLLVHDREAEEAFVAAGHGASRRELFYNGFLLAGPASDPAKIAGLADPAEALRRVAAARAPFASRGDDSGTNKAELRLWKQAGIDPAQAGAGWYRELGAGMGATLNTAAELGAYVLVDDATWDTFENKRELTSLLEGAPALRNVYSVILLSPAKPAKHPEAKAFADWLASEEGQRAVAGFQPRGKPLFRPLLLGGDGAE